MIGGDTCSVVNLSHFIWFLHFYHLKETFRIALAHFQFSFDLIVPIFDKLHYNYTINVESMCLQYFLSKQK